MAKDIERWMYEVNQYEQYLVKCLAAIAESILKIRLRLRET